MKLWSTGCWLVGWFVLALSSSAAESPPAMMQYWDLIHDEAVLADLKLTAAQRQAWRAALDPLDLACFPLRNKPAAEAEAGLAKLIDEAKVQVGKILRPQQAQRLEQVLIRVQGTDALLRDDMASKLKLTDEQRQNIEKTISETRQAQAKIQRQLLAANVDAASAQEEAARLATSARDRIVGTLTDEQKTKWANLMARDSDPAKIGRTAFKAPDLAGGSDVWLNSQPLSPQSLRGRVVVVHFFAFGCINCIHNYPTYRQWQKQFAGKDVQIIGIHTPETKAEHNVETLQQKLKAEQLEFPVLVDNEKANWNAWGNGMWPAVYVLDKRGYLRRFWAGELKWQGATGDVQLSRLIETLLKEE